MRGASGLRAQCLGRIIGVRTRPGKAWVNWTWGLVAANF
jgi:hypothetical protein